MGLSYKGYVSFEMIISLHAVKEYNGLTKCRRVYVPAHCSRPSWNSPAILGKSLQRASILPVNT